MGSGIGGGAMNPGMGGGMGGGGPWGGGGGGAPLPQVGQVQAAPRARGRPDGAPPPPQPLNEIQAELQRMIQVCLPLLQCVAVGCSGLQWVAVDNFCLSAPVAVCCNMLHCIAVC